MAGLSDIVQFANNYLHIDEFEDYCPNGLQVEGCSEVKKILCGVTASQALLDRAVDCAADMVLVHHGFFWKNEPLSITNVKRKKIKTLLVNDISLVAYHLPLDAHPVCGNNTTLANMLGVELGSSFGPGRIPIIASGVLTSPVESKVLAGKIESLLGREPLHLSVNANKVVSKVAICSGGAQNYFSYAIEQGVDVFITGEVSEQNYHMAIESGVDFISAGHHATERYGVQALADILRNKFSIEVEYFEIPNPV
ncbi:MAG: Nif3-like dinuclear metal center hexameric protein [Gammaproteobacteria bacterium]|nr:Nif3-like dinuclear metal center hexameric protein [Gammaproteobacteria bacterium]